MYNNITHRIKHSVAILTFSASRLHAQSKKKHCNGKGAVNQSLEHTHKSHTVTPGTNGAVFASFGSRGRRAERKEERVRVGAPQRLLMGCIGTPGSGVT